MDNRPIGVFDSGLGGLTAVGELARILPNERIVYFGDTGRVPYGTRSRETIERYAMQDEQFLLSRDVKVIIAACGTVSSVAPHTGDALPVPFFGVVEPAAAAAAKASVSGRIGVIGTTATIRSGAYERQLKQIDSSFEIISRDCPLFVPIVEAGWIDDDEVARLCAERYLKDICDFGVDTLILGCTHYPLIAKTIGSVVGDGVRLISASREAAHHCAAVLRERDMLCEGGDGAREFFVTDRPEGFMKTAGLLLSDELRGSVTQITVG